MNGLQAFAPGASLTFQGKSGVAGWLARAGMGATLASTLCGAASASQPDKPWSYAPKRAFTLGSEGQYYVVCRTMDVGEDKFLLCNGSESSAIAPFKENNNETGLTAESSWEELDSGLAYKTITVDNEQFVICAGNKTVAIAPLSSNKPK